MMNVSSGVTWKAVVLFVVLNINDGWCVSTTRSSGTNSGYFTSPNYPSNYPNSHEELYIAELQTPGPQQVRLDYVMDIEQTEDYDYDYDFIHYENYPGYPFGCWDYVYIPDLDTWLCGRISGITYLSITGDTFNFTFRSDHYKSKTGFNITFTVLEGNCNATLQLQQNLSEWVLLPITDMMTRTSVVFSVRSCHEVQFLLTKDPEGDSSALWRKVTIGRPPDEKSSELSAKYNSSEAEETLLVHHSQPILDCCLFKTFWIRWRNTTLKVGEGSTVENNGFLSEVYGGNHLPIRFIHIQADANLTDIMFEAPFPEEYCQGQPLSTPDMCPTTVASTTPQDADDTTTEISQTTRDAFPNFPLHPVNHTREQRPCKCVRTTAAPQNMTSQEKKEMEEKQMEMVQQIKKNLTVLAAKVSASRRRYISATDDRVSSKVISAIIALICFSPFVIIVASDCYHLAMAVYRAVNARSSQNIHYN